MENEIKVNEFVRTKDGVMDKVIIDYKGKCNNPNCNRKHISCEKNYYNEDEIVKHSLNLADLIEVNDIAIMSYNGIVFQKFVSRDDIVALKLKEYKLLEILTKEQFESISYKVKE